MQHMLVIGRLLAKAANACFALAIALSLQPKKYRI